MVRPSLFVVSTFTGGSKRCLSSLQIKMVHIIDFLMLVTFRANSAELQSSNFAHQNNTSGMHDIFFP